MNFSLKGSNYAVTWCNQNSLQVTWTPAYPVSNLIFFHCCPVGYLKKSLEYWLLLFVRWLSVCGQFWSPTLITALYIEIHGIWQKHACHSWPEIFLFLRLNVWCLFSLVPTISSTKDFIANCRFVRQPSLSQSCVLLDGQGGFAIARLQWRQPHKNRKKFSL